MPFSKKIQIANDGSKSILTSGYSKTIFYICLYLKAWLVEPSDVGTTVNTSLVDVYVLFSIFFCPINEYMYVMSIPFVQGSYFYDTCVIDHCYMNCFCTPCYSWIHLNEWRFENEAVHLKPQCVSWEPV